MLEKRKSLPPPNKASLLEFASSKEGKSCKSETVSLLFSSELLNYVCASLDKFFYMMTAKLRLWRGNKSALRVRVADGSQ